MDTGLGSRVRRVVRTRWDLLLVVAAGGALGAAGRFGAAKALPSAPDEFPWSTFLVNATGCLLLGLLMVCALDVWPTSRYLRPFLGVGLLGGYTTFSTSRWRRATWWLARQQLAGVYLVGRSLGASRRSGWAVAVGRYVRGLRDRTGEAMELNVRRCG